MPAPPRCRCRCPSRSPRIADPSIDPVAVGPASRQRGRASPLGSALPRLGVLALLAALHADRRGLRRRGALRGAERARSSPRARSGEITGSTDEEVAQRLAGAARGLDGLARAVLHGPVQPRRRAGQDRACSSRMDAGASRPASTPTTHILKPAVAGLDDHDLNEHLCLDAARRAGLIAVRTEIARFADETAVVVTRYDRVDGDRRCSSACIRRISAKRLACRRRASTRTKADRGRRSIDRAAARGRCRPTSPRTPSGGLPTR